MRMWLLWRRARVPSPAMVVALAALFVALGGSAAAAVLITSGSIKNGTIRGIDVRNGGLTGLDVKNNTLVGADVEESTLGQVAAAANAGALDGLDSSAFLTRALRSGETMVGVFGASAPANAIATASITFRPRLPEDIPIANAHRQAASTTSENCPGVGQAAAGHLCLYEKHNAGMEAFQGFRDPQGDVPLAVRAIGTVPVWFSALFNGNVRGIWAVTAP